MGKAMPETIVKKLLEEDEDKINSTFEKLSEHLKMLILQVYTKKKFYSCK